MIIPKNAPRCLAAARNWHFQYIAENMRPDEQAHWMALSGASVYSADVAAAGFINTPGLHFVVLRYDGAPAVAGGFSRLRGATYEGWMVGTIGGWEGQWRDIQRAVRWAIREQFRAGAQRLQIITLESRHAACEWYERALGMMKESTIARAGANGEDLVMYTTFREAWL